MRKEEINKYIGLKSLSIVEAMGKIDLNARGILYIVDVENRLIGSLSDGDIRRWILHSGDLTSSIDHVMNKNPNYLYEDNKHQAKKIMSDKSLTSIPILDDDNSIVDIAFLSVKEKRNESLKDIPVVIMAGGKGTRLYPYTKILPKPLIPIGDTPILERIIDYYTNFGINDFYLTVNYKKGMIKSYFDDLEPSYLIKYVEENKPLGTGGSLKLIEDKFDKPIFVTNCDALILADYNDIYQHHIQSGNDITMVSALKNFQVPYGVLHTSNNGILESMEEKPNLSYFINTGMYIINPTLIETIPNDQMFHMTHLVENVLKQGGKVGTYPISEDSFLDMGELNEMKRMEEKLKI